MEFNLFSRVSQALWRQKFLWNVDLKQMENSTSRKAAKKSRKKVV